MAEVKYRYSKMIFWCNIPKEHFPDSPEIVHGIFLNIKNPIRKYLKLEFGLEKDFWEGSLTLMRKPKINEEDYKILGVTKDISEEEISKRYKRLAKKYHPDVNKEIDSTKKFQEINGAYQKIKRGTTNCIFESDYNHLQELGKKYDSCYIVYPELIDRKEFWEAYFLRTTMAKLIKFIKTLPKPYVIVDSKAEAIKIRNELNNELMEDK